MAIKKKGVTKKVTKQESDEKKRLDRVRADKIELEIEKMKGKYIPFTEALSIMSNAAMNFRSKLVSLRSLSGQLSIMEDPVEIEELIEKTVDKALNEIVTTRENLIVLAKEN